MSTSTAEFIVTDPIDQRIIHGLQLDGRVPFRRLAQVLDVSEQTVARRYRRLRSEGVLRVIGLVDARRFGRTNWVVRIQCRPDSTRALADVLARRPDVAWVTLTAGGAEIVCTIVAGAPGDSGRDVGELLLERLPRTAQVLTFGAYALLHPFGDGGGDWTGYGAQLEGAAAVAQRPAHPATTLPDLDGDDEILLAALACDGRTSWADLAALVGRTPARVARRLEGLRDDGVLYYDVELSPDLLGFRAAVILWLTVGPADLARVGDALAALPEVAFCGAITGTANVFASVVCRSSEALYRFVTERVGALTGVREVEISPQLRRLKQAGSLLDGGRLTDPPDQSRRRTGARSSPPDSGMRETTSHAYER